MCPTIRPFRFCWAWASRQLSPFQQVHRSHPSEPWGDHWRCGPGWAAAATQPWPRGRRPEHGVSPARPGAPALPSLWSLQGLIPSLSCGPFVPDPGAESCLESEGRGLDYKQGAIPWSLWRQPGPGGGEGEEAFPALRFLGTGWCRRGWGGGGVSRRAPLSLPGQSQGEPVPSNG